MELLKQVPWSMFLPNTHVFFMKLSTFNFPDVYYSILMHIELLII